jgi:hypothetical protein
MPNKIVAHRPSPSSVSLWQQPYHIDLVKDLRAQLSKATTKDDILRVARATESLTPLQRFVIELEIAVTAINVLQAPEAQDVWLEATPVHTQFIQDNRATVSSKAPADLPRERKVERIKREMATLFLSVDRFQVQLSGTIQDLKRFDQNAIFDVASSLYNSIWTFDFRVQHGESSTRVRHITAISPQLFPRDFESLDTILI